MKPKRNEQRKRAHALSAEERVEVVKRATLEVRSATIFGELIIAIVYLPLFALSHRNRGQYVLLDVKSGKTLWTGMPRAAENAAIVRAGNLIVALEDDADLVIGRVNAGGFQEVKRYTVASGATWAQPVIAGNRIYVKDASSLTLWTIN